MMFANLKKSAFLFSFTIVICILLCSLISCKNANVSEKAIKEDIANYERFKSLNTEIDSFTVIKRMTNEKDDTIYINVQGKNDVFSVSLNYKMTYNLYNEGWLLEAIESYTDEGEYYNEIIPLAGPTQEDVDNFTSSIDWHSFASFSEDLIKQANWEITNTEFLELDNYYGRAEYLCNITFDYACIKEKVTIPFYFSFNETAPDGSMGWSGFIEGNIEAHTRDVHLNDDICGDWYYECDGLSWSLPLRQIHREAKLSITGLSGYSSSKGEWQRKWCNVENYTYNNDGKIYSTSGKMMLKAYYNDDDGKISSLSLDWCDNQAHPQQCDGLSILLWSEVLLQTDYIPSGDLLGMQLYQQ